MDPADVVSRGFTELDGAKLYEILRLRSEVFVVEQACVYLDIDGRDIEPGTLHHWIERDSAVAAYARTLTDPDDMIRVGRVATSPRFRGDGLAAALMSHIIAITPGVLVLDAQSYLVDWYRRLGFSPDGEEFVEDGIPHVPMVRGVLDDRAATTIEA